MWPIKAGSLRASRSRASLGAGESGAGESSRGGAFVCDTNESMLEIGRARALGPGRRDPEEAATIFMVWVATWSDGTPAPMQ